MILQPHLIQKIDPQPDGMGGYLPGEPTDFKVVYGVLDLLNGSDRDATDNAITENSTHVLVIPSYTDGITDNMRVVDSSYRVYDITFSDNPGGQNHHNELLLTLIQGKEHEWSELNG